MINLVITGALGHIGSRFIRKLPADLINHVVLLDNLSTQRYPALFDLPREISFVFHEADVCTADLDQYFAHADVVVHLAAITNAERSFAIRDQIEQTNFVGTQRVAQACARHGCKLVFISTTSVYGSQRTLVDEDCSLSELQPQSPYAESKLRAEQMLQEEGDRNNLNYVICRFGTIFGASVGMRFHTAINKFIWHACMGRPLTVWRTAMDQQRPYLDLGDAVRSVEFIVRNALFPNGVYNILTLNTTVRRIIDIIQSYVPNTTVEYVDSPIMNQLSYNVSNSRFSDLGFAFHGSLEQGIYETVHLIEPAMRHQEYVLR